MVDNTQLETKRLYLRKMELSDFINFKTYYKHPEVSKYMGVNGSEKDIKIPLLLIVKCL